jgi:hypothetical protein
MAPPSTNIRQSPTYGTETSRGNLYVYGLTALLALGLVKYIYQTLSSPLRKIPGPFLARFTRLWEVQAVRGHDNPTFNIKLHEKYGAFGIRLRDNPES